MKVENFTELFSDPVNRIERCHGLLKNHGNPFAPNFMHLIGFEADDILSLE